MKNSKRITFATVLLATLTVSAQPINWDLYTNLFSNLNNWPAGTNSIKKLEIGTDAYSSPCYPPTNTWHLGGDNIYPAVNPIYMNGDQAIVAILEQPQLNIGTCYEFPFILKANNKERIFITPAGNVGIGPNNIVPSAALDVSDGNGHLKIYGDGSGTIESIGGISLNTIGGLTIADQSATLFGANLWNGVYVSDVDFNLFSTAYGSVFKVEGSSGYTEIRVNSPLGMPNNRVLAIKDVANSRDLFVVKSDGKVYAREVEITLVPNFPDYVFDKNYKLPKISEVAKYIEQNKHLKGFEKGEFYEKNGINVNEMFVKQQEKIEELTLYIIQLEKRLSELEKK